MKVSSWVTRMKSLQALHALVIVLIAIAMSFGGCMQTPSTQPLNQPTVAAIIGDSSAVAGSIASFTAFVPPDSLPSNVEYRWTFSDTTLASDTMLVARHRFVRNGIDTVRCYLSTATRPNFRILTKLVVVLGEPVAIWVNPDQSQLELAQSYSFGAKINAAGKLLYRWRFLSSDSSEIDLAGNPVNFTVLPSRSFLITVTVIDSASNTLLGVGNITRAVNLPTQNVSALLHGFTRMEMILTGSCIVHRDGSGSNTYDTEQCSYSMGSVGVWNQDTLSCSNTMFMIDTLYGVYFKRNASINSALTVSDNGLIITNVRGWRESDSKTGRYWQDAEDSSFSASGKLLVLTYLSSDTTIYMCWQASNGNSKSEIAASSSDQVFATQWVDLIESKLISSNSPPAILEVRLYR